MERFLMRKRKPIGTTIQECTSCEERLESWFFENPKWKHWSSVKRVILYIKGTCDMELCSDGLQIGGVLRTNDSDCARDVKDRN